MGVLHETGHALYERGLPRDWRRQPVGNARGMVLHESQSLLIEMQACRCRRLRRPSPRRACARPSARRGPAWEADNIHRLYTRVEPGFIRVDADEVTYPLHIMLRYRLERAMLAGDLALADLPARLERRHEGAAGHRAARTTRSAACRTSIGPTAPGAISRPTRWARWPRRSSSPQRASAVPDLMARSARAISRRCWAGCVRMCTARARSPTRIQSCHRRPARRWARRPSRRIWKAATCRRKRKPCSTSAPTANAATRTCRTALPTR